MITRRGFLRTAAGVGLGAAAIPLLEACSGVAGNGSSDGGGGSTDLSLSWWGGSDRAKRTQEVVKSYEQQHTNIKISPQFSAWDDYWTKMDTLAAGAGLPDVMQMDMGYIGGYTQKARIKDLSSYKSTIDLGDFDKDQLQQGTIDGKLMGISLGGNIPAVPYNASAIKDAGMQPPAADVDWEGFAHYLAQLAPKLPNGMLPSDDGSGVQPAFEVWVRQRGRDLWTKDGKVAFTQDDVTEWFAYWEGLRKHKLIVPGKVVVAAAQVGTPDASPLVKKKAAFTYTWSNFIGQYQVLMKPTVELMRYPQGAQTVGDYVKASMLFSESAKTDHGDAGAKFIDFFIHDPKAVKALGVERGVPGSAAARTLLKQDAESYIKKQIDFQEQVGPKTREKTVLDPLNSGDVIEALIRETQAIALGRQSVTDGAKKFYDEAQSALNS